MNLTQMIAVVRQDLHDEDSGNYRWTDAVITRHINRVLAELSESIPVPAKATVATVAGARELDISGLSDRIMVAAVEYPVEGTPPEYQQFSLWGDNLTILTGRCPDGDNCSIYYGVSHTIDTQGSTLPGKYTDLVVGGACAYAAIELALYTINRVNSGGANAPEALLEWGNQKLKIFRQELRRLGRRNRIRVNELTEVFSSASGNNQDLGLY
jgi:hypothetical protein